SWPTRKTVGSSRWTAAARWSGRGTSRGPAAWSDCPTATPWSPRPTGSSSWTAPARRSGRRRSPATPAASTAADLLAGVLVADVCGETHLLLRRLGQDHAGHVGGQRPALQGPVRRPRPAGDRINGAEPAGFLFLPRPLGPLPVAAGAGLGHQADAPVLAL